MGRGSGSWSSSLKAYSTTGNYKAGARSGGSVEVKQTMSCVPRMDDAFKNEYLVPYRFATGIHIFLYTCMV